MTEQEYDHALLTEIERRINANLDEMERQGLNIDFFHGANTALEELAVQFGLVDDFGVLVSQRD